MKMARRIVNLKWKWHCARDRLVPRLNFGFIDFFVASVRYSIGCSRLKRRHDKLVCIWQPHRRNLRDRAARPDEFRKALHSFLSPESYSQAVWDIHIKLYNNISKLRVDRTNSKKERKINGYVFAASALKFDGRLDAFGFHILISNEATCGMCIFSWNQSVTK